MVLDFGGSTSDIRDFFVMPMFGWLVEVYIPFNLWGFKPPLYCLSTKNRSN